jgi:lipopolysaccharide transport system ATP-binding protein
MRKREIDRKLDEIVDFSGVERYIDTPVKRYSSGMSVRLAFAIAAHLESEILIVDEVLAVGDAEFQKKCLGKMETVGRSEGRTVLFVSHNMGAVQELCRRGILIDSGEIIDDGSASDCISQYYESSSLYRDDERPAVHTGNFSVYGFQINRSVKPTISAGEGFETTVTISGAGVDNPYIFFIIENTHGHQLLHDRVNGRDIDLKVIDGEYLVTLNVPGLWLAPGKYSAYFKFLAPSSNGNGRIWTDRILLSVTGSMDNSGRSLLHPPMVWTCTPKVLDAPEMVL